MGGEPLRRTQKRKRKLRKETKNKLIKKGFVAFLTKIKRRTRIRERTEEEQE